MYERLIKEKDFYEGEAIRFAGTPKAAAFKRLAEECERRAKALTLGEA